MITLEIANSIATLTLRRPPVNAISDRLIELFEDRLDEIDAQPDCKVVHFRSDQKVFCAGADLTEVRQRFDALDGSERAHRFVSRLQLLYDRIERLPQVTVAEIAGAAMGGGLELALACDLRIIAIDARVGLPEISLGLIPAGGGTQRLTRLCGRAIAARLIFGAETVVGADAVQLGLAQWAADQRAAPDGLKGVSRCARRHCQPRQRDCGSHRNLSDRRAARQQEMHCGGR